MPTARNLALSCHPGSELEVRMLSRSDVCHARAECQHNSTTLSLACSAMHVLNGNTTAPHSPSSLPAVPCAC
eukprot:16795-Pelagomonas_calceolata.AAC.9